MGKDTVTYNARELEKYYDGKNPKKPEAEEYFPKPVNEVVLEILKSAGCELKREEIIPRFQQKQDCKDLDVSEVVSGALNLLVKNRKIERTQHGYYKVL